MDLQNANKLWNNKKNPHNNKNNYNNNDNSNDGGIAPNQVIARSEFEVHRQMYKEWM